MGTLYQFSIKNGKLRIGAQWLIENGGVRFHYERVLCEGTFMNTRWNKWRNWLGNEGMSRAYRELTRKRNGTFFWGKHILLSLARSLGGYRSFSDVTIS
jgi:hypothetical protein